jgi:uncharacterized protein YcbK (DUF882 family)
MDSFSPAFMQRISGTCATGILIVILLVSWSWATEDSFSMDRYFYSGDGKINLYSERTEKSFSGVYRKGPGIYDEAALERICRLYGAPGKPMEMELSLRLIEFIDYLEDHFNPGGKVTITSGYRKPEYNTMLREKGNLAAKASLHQYGMAADIKIQGVKAKAIWDYVRELKFGGAGYYHGDMVHIDVGPARSWDETTSGVGTGISDDNKLIGIVTDYDIYQPGMTVSMRFIRMTAFPIRVGSDFFLIRQAHGEENDAGSAFQPEFAISRTGSCTRLNNISEMKAIKWQLPMDIKPGRYKIEAGFCDDAWPDMPPKIQTPAFEIKGF